jgi:hypothetical protein
MKIRIRREAYGAAMRAVKSRGRAARMPRLALL